jgi:hypothetical protein
LILLTHGYFLSEDPKELEIMKPYVPLGILYISAYLESKKIAHEVFDSTFSSFEDFKNNLIKKKKADHKHYINVYDIERGLTSYHTHFLSQKSLINNFMKTIFWILIEI